MQRAILNITGMTCGDNVGKVRQALEAITGVKTVKVAVREGKAAVQFDETATSAERLKIAVEEAGYGVDTAGASSACKGCSCCGDLMTTSQNACVHSKL
jgi:copper chaperone CopZ